MEIPKNEQDTEPSFSNVYELPGEPAIVINGVPDIPACDTAPSLCNSLKDENLLGGSTGFGEWLEGRVVNKMFGDRYYYGVIIEFDNDTGWYRVEYEDGDFEDLDWHGVERVLLPMDITVPLRTLARKTLKRSRKAEKNRKNKSGNSRGDPKEMERSRKKSEDSKVVLPTEPAA
ncbi:dirigent protein 17-like [Cucurbita maxima]|uniref:Dirigent protein 17-like n=1 Tax=Cucurbita maxima TaxID=3661 RepID=A0A6J1I6W0_CUCMA|nr:dirigent protein 17-like [Cucurbita maxima]XP_022972770.1 dirigent protein 17-like [Cucurbita maxima]XP_022972771.1 dirigent protein 17-like [Cucurbita maxima]